MIAQLDEPVTDDSLAPKIYQMKFVSAVDIEDVLNELFLKKKETTRPYYYYYDEQPAETADRDVGRLYGKVRITTEPIFQFPDYHLQLKGKFSGCRGYHQTIGCAIAGK